MMTSRGVHRNPRLTISRLQKAKISFAELGDNDAESVKSRLHLQDIATGHFSRQKNYTRFVPRYQRSMQTAKKVAIKNFGEPPPQMKSWLFHNGRNPVERILARTKILFAVSKPCQVQLVGACRNINPISVQLVVPSSAPPCPIS